MQQLGPRGLAPGAAAGKILTTRDAGGDLEAGWEDPAPLALDDLTDVDAAAPAVGDSLTWDGVAWVPFTPPTPVQTALVPLTTVSAGEPTFLWTDTDELVLVEVTL